MSKRFQKTSINFIQVKPHWENFFHSVSAGGLMHGW